jgi:hypothetical protein
MPIRFRCQYCNQLLGIARRKAGTHVECPTCHTQVLVPLTDPGLPAMPAEAPPAAPLFERSDFDDFLRPEPVVPVAPAAPHASHMNPTAPRPPAYDVERLEQGPVSVPSGARPPGLYLSPTQATLLTVAAVFFLAIAFGAGLLVGRYGFGP